RLRRDGHRGRRRAGAGGGLGRRRGGLAVVRRRLPGRGVRARHRVARTGRVPAPGGAEVHPARRRAPAGRDRGRRVLAAVRQRRDHRADGDASNLRHTRFPGPRRALAAAPGWRLPTRRISRRKGAPALIRPTFFAATTRLATTRLATTRLATAAVLAVAVTLSACSSSSGGGGAAGGAGGGCGGGGTGGGGAPVT